MKTPGFSLQTNNQSAGETEGVENNQQQITNNNLEETMDLEDAKKGL